ncbi:MAG TPA: FtsX-like permease family protein, partial [Albitalea sp.]
AFDGWTVRTPADAERERGSAPRVFDFALKGAGLLGLLVGGIGVANTLQVVLARRTAEIAVLKTLGYGRGTLLALFATETGLLGLAGSLVGAGAALAVAGRLATLLDRTEGALLIEYAVDPTLVVAGIAVGVVTAVLFGLQAIVRAAAVRPSTLLRQQATTGGRRARAISIALAAALLVTCTLVGALVMGSLARGALVIGAGMAGLVVLGIVHAALLFLLVRLPLPVPLVRMAQRNLRHRPVRAVFAMVALFAGVFSIGFAGATLLSGRDRVESRRGTLEGSNFTVFAGRADEATIMGALADAGATDIVAGPSVRVRRATNADGAAVRLPELLGREPARAAEALTLVAGAWRDEPGSVLLPAAEGSPPPAAIGEEIRVETATGTELLRVAGLYRTQPGAMPGSGLPTQAIVARETALRLAGTAGGFVAHAHVPADRIEHTAAALGAALPHAFVVSRADLNAMLIRAMEGLFAFAAGIAGLALLAGAVLVANAVGLGLLERRRELGILKAIGWTRARVLAGVLLENGLLGALAGVTGMAGVAAAIAFTRARMPAAGVTLPPRVALVLASAAVAIALAAALLTAWRPVRVRPLVVLREE